MKKENLFSYTPQNPNEKIWRVYPDPKSNLIVLEIRTTRDKEKNQKNTSQLLILDSQKKELVRQAEMEASQTLLNFFDNTILLSEINLQYEMPLPKGIQALNIDFEIIWQLEEVSYYTVLEEETQDKNQNIAKVIFSLQSNYYSVPLKLNPVQNQAEFEAKEEEFSNLKDKVTPYFQFTYEYATNHINYKSISNFIFERTNHQAQDSIFYIENENYLLCSYVVGTENQANQNYLLCTNREGNLKEHFLIKQNTKNPQELTLSQNQILWTEQNVFFCFLISK